jgi:hypothetical protein
MLVFLVLQLGSVLLGLATTTPSLIPSENAPLAPMLFKMPCRATGVSFDRNESSEPVARGTKPDVAWAMPRRPSVARAAAMTLVLATRDRFFHRGRRNYGCCRRFRKRRKQQTSIAYNELYCFSTSVALKCQERAETRGRSKLSTCQSFCTC